MPYTSRKPKIIPSVGFFYALLTLFFAKAHGDITVAAAASMQYPMEELSAAFTAKTLTKLKMVYGASGKLVLQIKQGAPFDVFISADMTNPGSLVQWGLAKPNVKPYAFGKLVMWTLQDLDFSKGLNILASSDILKIGIADSNRAPYGKEAVNALNRSGMFKKVSSKIILGESIAQINQYILTGNVQVGFTAKSVVVSGEMRGKGHWVEVDSSLYNRIAQGAVVCKHGLESDQKSAMAFLDFLYSEPSKKILEKYGYVFQ